jgi:hypothetical protein
MAVMAITVLMAITVVMVITHTRGAVVFDDFSG